MHGVARYRRSFDPEDSGEGGRRRAEYKLFARGYRMSNRDEFSQRTKNAIALIAGQLCSFRGCLQPTSGPSAESPDTVNLTGKTAHIHGAASGPGSRRYLASMTREERIDIANAIWLCAYHADLIDNDEVNYTADELRAMKREHEAYCTARQRNATLAGEAISRRNAAPCSSLTESHLIAAPLWRQQINCCLKKGYARGLVYPAPMRRARLCDRDSRRRFYEELATHSGRPQR